MKNFDLIWARESAGLTQQQAADKMEVTRRTFSRWETGIVTMPRRKWSAFLRAVEMKQSDIPARPKPLAYDAEGYPIGFDRTLFDDFDEEDDALEKLEGGEYLARARERYRLLNVRTFPDQPGLIDEAMAKYDDEQARWLAHKTGSDLV